MPAWKHSQYFFRQPLFLQLHPLLCRAPPVCRLSCCRDQRMGGSVMWHAGSLRVAVGGCAVQNVRCRALGLPGRAGGQEALATAQHPTCQAFSWTSEHPVCNPVVRRLPNNPPKTGNGKGQSDGYQHPTWKHTAPTAAVGYPSQHPTICTSSIAPCLGQHPAASAHSRHSTQQLTAV